MATHSFTGYSFCCIFCCYDCSCVRNWMIVRLWVFGIISFYVAAWRCCCSVTVAALFGRSIPVPFP